MGRAKNISFAELAIWSLGGLAAGFAIGVGLSAYAGVVTRERVRRVAGDLRRPSPTPRFGRSLMAAAAAQELGADPALAGLPIDVRAVGARTIELRGWVPDRALRSLASRAVRRVAEIDAVVNNILVRGEDDRPVQRATPSGQSA